MGIVREVTSIFKYKSVPNADKVGGGQKIQKFGIVINGSSPKRRPLYPVFAVEVILADA